MTDIDMHEIRLEAGQASMAMMDILDEDTLDLVVPLVKAAHELVAHLRSEGKTTLQIATVLNGMATAAALGQAEAEGEGPTQ